MPVVTREQAAELRRLRNQGKSPPAASQFGWSVPRIWPRATCFIIGGGPSLRGVDFSPIHDRRVLGVNEAFKLGPWVDAMTYGDCRYGTQNRKDLAEFGGLKISTCKTGNAKLPPDVFYLHRAKRPNGISTNPAVVHWNMSSGACAINIAFLLGSKKIVLLGFDMKHATGDDFGESLIPKPNDPKLPSAEDRSRVSHWHDNYPDHGPKHNPYTRFLVPFPFIAKDLKRLGVQCINASPDSAIEDFPKVTVEEGLHVE